MKIIIAGGRNFDDYQLLEQRCNDIIGLYSHDEIEIVSGTANGADKLGEVYASKRGYSVKRFSADWNKHGRSAGYKRNEDMARYGDVLIAFWDKESKGTKHMIDLAMKHKLSVNIVNY